MAPGYGSDSDSSSSSSSSSSSPSDDEYLTTSAGGGAGTSEQDREAIIRRKLLESFYGSSRKTPAGGGGGGGASADRRTASGKQAPITPSSFPESRSVSAPGTIGVSKSAPATAAAAAAGVALSAAPRRRPIGPTGSGAGKSPQLPPARTSSNDLDSPDFDPTHHTISHVRTSTVQSLLETDERLALDVRTLDSTMQTLVYENYSKFIGATDAIKSIGRSVSANEDGLLRLETGVRNIERFADSIDSTLRTPREAVAEKIRVSRLLSRLDALLKLPSTLRTQITDGRYRLAAQSHFNATQILGRHSAGFESLRSIEMECNVILRDMIHDLRRKLLYWSGNDLANSSGASKRRIFGGSSPLFVRKRKELFGEIMNADDDDAADILDNDLYDGSGKGAIPNPPKNVAEIFECAGTLLMFSTSSLDERRDERRAVTVGVVTRHDDDADSEGDDNSAVEQEPRQEDEEDDPFSSGLTTKECKSLALSACGRFLERLLDEHHIQIQERAAEQKKLRRQEQRGLTKKSVLGIRQTAMALSDVMRRTDLRQEGVGTQPNDPEDAMSSSPSLVIAGSYLIPTTFLDGMLESATLYGVSFYYGDDEGGSNNSSEDLTRTNIQDEDRILLGNFVSGVFGSFLGHVRMILLERTLRDIHDEMMGEGVVKGLRADATSAAAVVAGEELDPEDVAYTEISAALTHLLQSVRELASGLALPEVGLDVQVASSLVDQTVEVTESMVRRRVAQKFHSLRARVIRQCIGPFVAEAAVLPPMDGNVVAGGKIETPRVVQIVQMSSVALSDGMQLVDDTIRSVLSRGAVLGSSATPVDSAMVKLAVQKHARKFSLWLASTLEVVAGCDPSDPKSTLEVKEVEPKDDDSFVDDGGLARREISKVNAVSEEAMSEMSEQQGEYDEEDESEVALLEVVSKLEEEASSAASSEITLAMAELCRLAERIVADSINQSIVFSIDEDPKTNAKSTGLFQSSTQSNSSRARNNFDTDGAIAARFRMAASRILVLYAMNRGATAAAFGAAGFFEMACSKGGEDMPSAPRSAMWQMLEVAKLTSIDCANVFGGERMATPAPTFADEDDDALSSLAPTSFPQRATTSSSLSSGPGMAAIKGLQLDVERMFTEKVQIYPHPSQLMEFSRNAVVALVLKIAFKALMEQARACTFTSHGYRQLQVDLEFLRQLVPHYVKDDFLGDGTNPRTSLGTLLNDVMLNAGDRCIDIEVVGIEEYYDPTRGITISPRSIVGKFMARDESEGGAILSRFVISEA